MQSECTIQWAPPQRGSSAADSASSLWNADAVQALFDLPFLDLLYRAQTVHRDNFPANEVQLSSLLSIKTGGCPEDCGYCSQSSRHQSADITATKLMSTQDVLAAARDAKQQGASRFCMGAAWRNPKQRDMDTLTTMVREVRALGLETCMTLGMLEETQAQALKQAGLDYYNHNLDTAPDFYGNIVSTRSYQDRLDTIRKVQDAGLRVCSGGIVGMGETRRQRAMLIAQLAALTPQPESVPINHLVPIKGTPLEDAPPLDELEFIRTVAVARISLPKSMVRLSAGRESMGEATQALCFAAGANSIFLGAKLLTTPNAALSSDQDLLARLGIKPMPADCAS
ncbi:MULTISPECIES: biotin synthase BioB [unclassified Herbaspirillum]|uniref:biotin synthase BioB n=1 Tax=unclassified Herbaspirillum TaxID=2624150 RepID=UPI001154577B|nr:MULTISPECIES: biotin synthase BioB [unclassified Herbaspirillum]MBB5393267.1 biotin synthase [Herbaspirillum sp. SJZ102]TQK03984.1 biotin synthase [Herbaspirillum sp. SJZ130]TQK08716.1 biotin synthase [Herbaspirillum sp. SJZ106]TWC71987.1 biotin synthase [Herbaspirillum sp. SJZ099]